MYDVLKILPDLTRILYKSFCWVGYLGIFNIDSVTIAMEMKELINCQLYLALSYYPRIVKVDFFFYCPNNYASRVLCLDSSSTVWDPLQIHFIHYCYYSSQFARNKRVSLTYCSSQYAHQTRWVCYTSTPTCKASAMVAMETTSICIWSS